MSRPLLLLVALLLGPLGGAADPLVLVAHAGGGHLGPGLRNSYQAIEASAARGFQLVELDFLPADDGNWYCFHDLSELGPDGYRLSDRAYEKVTGLLFRFTGAALPFGPVPVAASRAEAGRRLWRSRHGAERCDLRGLMQTLERLPDLAVVTDTKFDNRRLLQALAAYPAEQRRRFVPQVYDLAQFREAEALGFGRIVFTLYRQASFAGVESAVRSPALLAVALPREWTCLPPGHPRHVDEALLRRAPAVFLHTVNRRGEVCGPGARAVTGVYTDELQPPTSAGALW